ncbi:MAG: M20/M25/M40 family metallo-hydrolase [Spirochaetales bacterium]|nr:M20/M25/M40 family metallo-hydrolase [Spirochaetales bacterium]
MNVEKYFRELIAIPSPSKNECKVSSYMKEKLSSFGFSYREDEVGNILFYRTLEGEKIVLSSHMDTVPPAVNAVMLEDDEKFFTDGTTALGADDKCGLAAILSVAEEYKGDDYAILLTVAEEIGLWGSSHLKKEFLDTINIKHVFVMDATGDVGTIINSQVGKSRVTLTFNGKKSHAGFKPENGINAIVMASNFISSIKTGRLEELTTSNIGSFIAEGTTNVVPDKATVVFEVRSNRSETRFEIIREYIAKATEAASKLGGSVDVFEEDLYTEYCVNEDSDIIRHALKSFSSIGIDAKIKSTTGGSDSNNLNKFGISSVVLTSGYYSAHSTSEYIEKKQLGLLYKIARALFN